MTLVYLSVIFTIGRLNLRQGEREGVATRSYRIDIRIGYHRMVETLIEEEQLSLAEELATIFIDQLTIVIGR